MFKVSFTGNCAGEPEVRYSQDGRPNMSFNVAVNTSRKSKEGEWTDHTDWIRVRTMKRIDYLTKALEKGSRVVVVGDLQIGTYQSKDGETKVSLDVWADAIETLSKKTAAGDEETHESAPVKNTQSAKAVLEEDFDSLPF